MAGLVRDLDRAQRSNCSHYIWRGTCVEGTEPCRRHKNLPNYRPIILEQHLKITPYSCTRAQTAKDSVPFDVSQTTRWPKQGIFSSWASDSDAYSRTLSARRCTSRPDPFIQLRVASRAPHTPAHAAFLAAGQVTTETDRDGSCRWSATLPPTVGPDPLGRTGRGSGWFGLQALL